MSTNPFRPLADAWDRLAGSGAEPSGLAAWIAGFRARRLFHTATLGPDVQLFGRPVLHLAPGATLQIGSGARISARAARTRIEIGPDATLQIGAGAVLDDVALLQAYGRVVIGDNARIGFGVAILDDEGVPGRPPAPVLIGAEARIGARATVLRGVRIGRGAIVAAGSLVTENVPAGATVAGVPAVVIDLPAALPAELEPVASPVEAAPTEVLETVGEHVNDLALAPQAAPMEVLETAATTAPAPAVSLSPAAPLAPAQGDGAAQSTPDADAVVLRPSTPQAAPIAPPTVDRANETEAADEAHPPVWPPHAKLRV